MLLFLVHLVLGPHLCYKAFGPTLVRPFLSSLLLIQPTLSLGAQNRVECCELARSNKLTLRIFLNQRRIIIIFHLCPRRTGLDWMKWMLYVVHFQVGLKLRIRPPLRRKNLNDLASSSSGSLYIGITAIYSVRLYMITV